MASPTRRNVKRQQTQSLKKAPSTFTDFAEIATPQRNTYKAVNYVTPERLAEGDINMAHPADAKIVAKILEKLPNRRDKLEIEFLMHAFEDIRFFRDMKVALESKYQELYKKLKIEQLDISKRVFQYGDVGRHFYIIIKGSVYVLLKKASIVDEEIHNPYANTPSNSARDNTQRENEKLQEERQMLKGFLKGEHSDKEKVERIEACYPGFFVVRQMQAGDSFGDIALESEGDRKRTATVICKEDSIFGLLSREDYNEILSEYIEKKRLDQINFLKQIDIFSHWSYSELSSLIHQIIFEKVQRGTVLFKEGSKPDKMYFIKDGEVEIKKKKFFQIPPTLEEEITRSRERASPAKQRAILTQKEQRIALLTYPEYFRYLEIIQKKPREYTATVYSSEALLGILTKEVEILFSLILQKFSEFLSDRMSLRFMKTHANTKKKVYEERNEKYEEIHKRERKDDPPSRRPAPPKLKFELPLCFKAEYPHLTKNIEDTKEADKDDSGDTIPITQILSARVNQAPIKFGHSRKLSKAESAARLQQTNQIEMMSPRERFVKRYLKDRQFLKKKHHAYGGMKKKVTIDPQSTTRNSTAEVQQTTQTGFETPKTPSGHSRKGSGLPIFLRTYHQDRRPTAEQVDQEDLINNFVNTEQVTSHRTSQARQSVIEKPGTAHDPRRGTIFSLEKRHMLTRPSYFNAEPDISHPQSENKKPEEKIQREEENKDKSKLIKTLRITHLKSLSVADELILRTARFDETPVKKTFVTEILSQGFSTPRNELSSVRSIKFGGSKSSLKHGVLRGSGNYTISKF